MESLCWMCLDWRDKTLNQTLRFRKVENWLETKPEGKHRCQCLVTHPTSEKTVHGQGHHSQSGGGPDVWPLSMSQSRMDRYLPMGWHFTKDHQREQHLQSQPEGTARIYAWVYVWLMSVPCSEGVPDRTSICDLILHSMAGIGETEEEHGEIRAVSSIGDNIQIQCLYPVLIW